MNSSVITFPGSNCDRDMDVALKKFGFKNKMVWHDDLELPKSDLVVLPGGFSYGDYLRCGSMASKSKIMKSVLNFAQGGGKVMGICNGFQILVEAGLLPGVLLRNKYMEFICKNVFVKINSKDNSYFRDIKKDIFELHIAHNEGNFFNLFFRTKVVSFIMCNVKFKHIFFYIFKVWVIFIINFYKDIFTNKLQVFISK